MTQHHYVYHSYEEWGRDYIGCRTCDCLPEEDTKYFGSFRDKTFSPTEKTILFVCETRIEASEIEIELHDFFDVAVNPQFANMAKATSTGFNVAGVIFGPRTEAQKKAQSEKMTGKYTGEKNPCYGRTGEKNPMYGIPRTEEEKKKLSVANSGEKNPNYGRTGALHPQSKAMIAIEPDGTQRHFGSTREATRELGIPCSSLYYHLEIGHVLKCGKFKGWQFLLENR